MVLNVKMAVGIVATVAILVAAGCSGGGDSSGASDRPLTKAQFVKQANVICEVRRAKLLQDVGFYVQRRGGNPNGPAALAATRSVLVPGMEAQIEAIRALGAPARQAKQVEAFLDAWQAGATKGRTISDPKEVGQLFVSAAKLARRLGLVECVYG